MTDRNKWSLVSIAAIVLFVVAAIFVGYSIITGEQMADMLPASTSNR